MRLGSGFFVYPDGTVKRARTFPMRRQTCKACGREYATNTPKRRDSGICFDCRSKQAHLTVIK